jgi:hypothetical protein
MYVLKNPLANEGLETPITRQTFHALDPEIMTLYRFDAGVDEGDDTFNDPPTDLGTIAMLDAVDDDDIQPDINNSDDFSVGADNNTGSDDTNFGGGDFGGGGAESDGDGQGGW